MAFSTHPLLLHVIFLLFFISASSEELTIEDLATFTLKEYNHRLKDLSQQLCLCGVYEVVVEQADLQQVYSLKIKVQNIFVFTTGKVHTTLFRRDSSIIPMISNSLEFIDNLSDTKSPICKLCNLVSIA